VLPEFLIGLFAAFRFGYHFKIVIVLEKPAQP
jgi:hypothetical protein